VSRSFWEKQLTIDEAEALASRLEKYAKTAKGEQHEDLKNAAELCDQFVRLCLAIGEVVEKHPKELAYPILGALKDAGFKVGTD
jgi:hypothetical protein